MSKEKSVLGSKDVRNEYIRPLVSANMEGSYAGLYVLVSHSELDNLIPRLMQMFELNGDKEQREALKQETKFRLRSWLDELYEWSGYDALLGGSVKPGARVLKDTK